MNQRQARLLQAIIDQFISTAGTAWASMALAAAAQPQATTQR